MDLPSKSRGANLSWACGYAAGERFAFSYPAVKFLLRRNYTAYAIGRESTPALGIYAGGAGPAVAGPRAAAQVDLPS